MSDAVAFSDEQVRRFTLASGDTNPIHRRQRPESAAAVPGMLQLLLCATTAQARERFSLRVHAAAFFGVVEVAGDYSLDVKANGRGRVMATIADGSRQLTSCHHTAGEEDPVKKSADGPDEHTVPHDGATAARVFEGRYTPDRRHLPGIGPHVEGVDSSLLFSVLWASYFSGSQWPGHGSVIERVRIRTFPANSDSRERGYFEARSWQLGRERFATAATLRTNHDDVLAFVTIHARSPIPIASGRTTIDIPPAAPTAATRTAMVIGAGRGLGAALIGELRSRGIRAIANVRSAAPATPELSHDDSDTWYGDAADPDYYARVAARLDLEHGALDLLVCNASPPISPAALRPGRTAALTRFVELSIQSTVVPLTHLLPLLERRGGLAVLVSSAFLSAAAQRLPAYMTHYLCAKAAVEMLFHAAAREYRGVRFMTVRPPRFLSDNTSLMKGASALPTAADTARWILSLTEKEMPHGLVVTLDSQSGGPVAMGKP